MTQAPIYMTQPVVVERDCILVEGKKYCRESNLTKRELGIGLLGLIILCVWIAGGLWGMDNGWEVRSVVLYFTIPVVVLLILLLWF